jgi:hypothetical protein
MRVAIVLYGQPRDYLKGYKNIMNFVKSQDCSFDFFYHCWKLNEGEYYNHSPWRHIDTNSLIFKENILTELNELYHPLSCEIEHQREVSFDEALYKDTIAFNNTTGMKLQNINNTLYNIYSRNKARKVLQTYLDNNTEVSYDYVVFTRFDIGVLPDLNLLQADKTKIYISDYHYPKTSMPDNFIIMPTRVFLEWFNYENLRELLDNAEVSQDMREFGQTIDINPEELLFAKYIYHYKNPDNIAFFKGGILD